MGLILSISYYFYIIHLCICYTKMLMFLLKSSVSNKLYTVMSCAHAHMHTCPHAYTHTRACAHTHTHTHTIHMYIHSPVVYVIHCCNICHKHSSYVLSRTAIVDNGSYLYIHGTMFSVDGFVFTLHNYPVSISSSISFCQ